ncbi:Lrp/AsnC family transcriptional regulator [Reichenbachiella ulvae]|uniref:Lrp/AsnC ligand binding domain-containing protein n=1 Tax=Reichenbachiella ulvae TaxID=2980104 RepID=A0ABT3CNI4_9BACT|nr:Lrp/AsnC ligand binding domain-containing protein [Reichenbachiella ulvae]MCV9385293.1 Lrp/AsnC ligand binding domain-containing protein [Reichenbachiella ulvae]
MHTKIKFDELDLKILGYLEEDGRMAFSHIANELGVSNTMIHQRVSAMQQNGILEKIAPIINERKIGYEWSAFTGLTLKDDSQSKDIIAELEKIPEVVECYYITGNYTLFLRVMAKSNEHMREVIYEKLDSIKGILKTESFIDFGCAFRRNIPLSN